MQQIGTLALQMIHWTTLDNEHANYQQGSAPNNQKNIEGMLLVQDKSYWGQTCESVSAADNATDQVYAL
jgi:hypothetical protein